MDKDGIQRGFSGISGLVSDLSSLKDVPKNSQTATESRDDKNRIEPKLGQHSTSGSSKKQNDDVSDSTHRADRSKSKSNDTYSSGDKNVSGNSGKWIFAIIGVFILIWFVNQADGPSNTTRSNSTPNYSPSIPKPTSSQPSVQTTTPSIYYQIPSVGRNNVLSVTEIRWCTKESIRIDAMQSVNTSQKGIDRFNRIVSDYNSRCGEYRYRKGNLSRAKREVETYRSQIVADAIREAREYDNTYTQSYSAKPSTSKITSLPKKPSVKLTREAQQLLTDLGYKLGPIDGLYGQKTSEAIKAFQRNTGITVDGWVDHDLLIALRVAKVKLKPESKSFSQPMNQADSNRPSNTNLGASTVPKTYFTRGSHKNDVLRIHGTPKSITKYSDHEVWRYDSSSVDISTRDQRVTEWNNASGNLKVTLNPGSNITTNNYFSRGSHLDDVLRVQGTPKSINKYSDHEVWRYGSSSVDISTRDQRVTEWNNASGNLKVTLNPGSNITTNNYFSRGSHLDDVLRVQGTPKSINKYSDHEVWRYGSSSVDISTRDQRVTEWNNASGNLKVTLNPGSNITTNNYFSRGSHLDDVLRVQGTPKSINKYSDHEVWRYGSSSVDISTRDQRVTEWNNTSGNLKVR